MRRNYDYSKLRGRIAEKLGSLKNYAESLHLSDTAVSNKLKNKTAFSQDEILESIKKEVLDNKVNIIHGNKNRKPINALSETEKNKIINLYKKSSVSIRKFCKFYNSRSYSCIYNTIKNYEKTIKNDNQN